MKRSSLALAGFTAAAIAVSLLAVSGAGGSGAQTPKRGGTLVIRLHRARAGLSQRPARELQPRRPRLGRAGSADGFRGWSRLHVRGKPRLEGRLHEAATVHADLPHPSRGALERRSPGHGAGLHLHAPGHTPSRFPGVQGPPRPHPKCACRGSQDLASRSAAEVRELARTSSGTSSRAHVLRGSDLTQVWSDRIDDPRTGRPIGSGPFLVERLERGRQLVLRRNPRYWGPHPGLRRAARRQIRAVAHRSQRAAEEQRARRRNGHSTFCRRGCSSAAGDALCGAAKHRLRAPRVPARTERSPGASRQTRSPRARVRDRPHRARPTDLGQIDPSARVLDSAVYLTQSRHYEPNWRAYRYRPAEARRLLDASWLPPRNGRHLLL